MNETALIARQLRRETEQGIEARKRLESSTKKAEQRAYASSTVYGQSALRQATGVIAEHMAKSLKNIGRGKGAVDGATVYNHLKLADTEVLAVLALKVALDQLAQDDKPSPQEVAASIGSAIEVELKLQWYQQQDKDLFRNVTNGFHHSTGTRQKATVYNLRFTKAGIQWKGWGRTVHYKVGNWALRSITETTGWITKETIKMPRSQKCILRFSREFIGLRDALMHRVLELSFCLWPMVCPPNDWTGEVRGGYLTEEIRGTAPMIRKVGGFGGDSKQGTIPVEFLNNLQRQSYRINPAILAVANWCYDNSRTVGKFIHDQPRDRLDSFNGDPKAEPERFKEWKRMQRSIDDFNAQLFQRNWRATETMFVANQYEDEVFWIPWSFDYRGRVYPQNTQLNPQGTDFDKSLLLFAEEGEVNEYWLAWHVCTTYGNDKLSHNDRVEWTQQNHELITIIAEDPIGAISHWEGVGEPWMFLAACIEYHACVITKTKQTSGLPIGIDATCSGLQHLSSMTRDAVAAKQVNVIRGDQDGPSDGYKTVAEAAIKYIEDESIHPYMNRKITKRTVMTVPYGVSRDSARAYIREALHDAGFDLSIKGRLGQVTDAVYRKAVPEVFAGPVDVMNWLQQTAMDLLDAGAEQIEWTTPSGFRVVQDIRKPRTKLIKTTLMGSVQQIRVADGFAGPDRQRHKGAIAPNLVHSLDASLLHLMFYEYDKPFTVIHDCILGRSCDMDEMMEGIRLHHAEIYKGKPLEDWAEQQGVEIPEGLIKDTLDLDLVNESPYFFC